MSKISVLSSHSKPTVPGPINHQIYCRKHGYSYLFDGTPYPLATPYDQKLQSIISALENTASDWLFWVDEDAFFMQHEVPLTRFLDVSEEVDFIICRSPINLEGKFTAINSGLFFVRNSTSAIQLLKDALAQDMRPVEQWWDHERHGLLIAGGDQERMLYLFETRGLIGKSVIIHPHEVFNSRVYHFTTSAADHFVCHLASHRDKTVPLRDMQRRFGLDRFLLPLGTDASAYAHSAFSDMPSEKRPEGVKQAGKHLAKTILQRIRRR